ncbi:defensin-like protein 183 [Vicia villosa]|uniref:defensin-like protein 183 n=1 Tax=Vicia villosa TaxID=3911 RepID=UPI00273C8E66|nr:defensin-like protein 183 [Vicia villosa]
MEQYQDKRNKLGNMANHIISNCLNIFVIIATIAAVQYSTVEAGRCSEVFNRCDDMDCPGHCKSTYGSRSLGHKCDQFYLCTCFFNQASSSSNICHIGNGTCYTGECDNGCCNSRCASLNHGSGTCIPNQFTKDRCLCSYRS